MDKLILATRNYKVGYQVREELSRTNFEAVVLDEYGEIDTETQKVIDFITEPSDVIVQSAYTLSGDYIGNKRTAHLLFKRGIKPEKANPTHNVCSIGFCEREQKWYGWSHRAIYGFGIGDEVKEGDCTNSSGFIEEYLKEHPEEDLSLPVGFIAKDLIDAKRMAIAFASSVS